MRWWLWGLAAAACTDSKDDASAGDAAPDAAQIASPSDSIVDEAPDAASDATPPTYSRLRLHHVQARGTHNSYHLPTQLALEEWQYEHLPLNEQLDDQDIRQFELDVHYDRSTDRFRVHHIPQLDANTTCEWLADCLTVLLSWSDAHPRHATLFVFVEPKDDVDRDKIHRHLPALEADIRAVWPRERLLTPEDVRGPHATLREAVTTSGWPSVDATRGRLALVLLDEGPSRDAYLAASPDLAGSLFFPLVDREHAHAAVFSENDAIGDEARIRDLVAAGFLVRSLSQNDEERAAALRAGVHHVSTDHPDRIDLGTEGAFRCNPVSAPPECEPADLESLGGDP